MGIGMCKNSENDDNGSPTNKFRLEIFCHLSFFCLQLKKIFDFCIGQCWFIFQV